MLCKKINMMYFFLPENFNELVSQGPRVLYDCTTHKKTAAKYGPMPLQHVTVKWKDQFPSAQKIERATLLF
jgi:hypothetical protein